MQHKRNNLQFPLTSASTKLTSEGTDVISNNNNLITNTVSNNITAGSKGKLYFCSICERQVTTFVDWNNHISGRKHRQIEKIGNIDAIVFRRILSMQKRIGSFAMYFDVDLLSDPISFKCNLCDTKVFNEDDLFKHLQCPLSIIRQLEKKSVRVEINSSERSGESENSDSRSDGQLVTSSLLKHFVSSDHPTNTDFRIDLHALSKSASKSNEANNSQKETVTDGSTSKNDNSVMYYSEKVEKKQSSDTALNSLVKDSRLTERRNSNHRETITSNNHSFNDAVCEANISDNSNVNDGLSFKRNLSKRKTRNNLRTDAVNSLLASSHKVLNSTDDQNDDVFTLCLACREYILSCNWEAHLKKGKHQLNQQMSNVNAALWHHIQAVKKKLRGNNRFFCVEKTSDAVAFRCNLCKISLRSETDIDQHLICECHKTAVSKFFQARRQAKRGKTYNHSDADDDQQRSIYSSPSLSSDLHENDGRQEPTALHQGKTVSAAGLFSADKVVDDVNNNNSNNNNRPFAGNGNDRRESNNNRDNVAAYDKLSSQPLERDNRSSYHDELLENAAAFDRFEGELTCNVCQRKIPYRHDELLLHTNECINSRPRRQDSNREIGSLDSDRLALDSLKRYLISTIDSRLGEYLTKEGEINVKQLTQFRRTFSYLAYRLYQPENDHRIRKFVCQPCSLTVTNDVLWIEHMCGPDHCLMYSGVKLSCYFCVICSVYMYASDAYVKSHAVQCLAEYPCFAESLFNRYILTNNARRIAIETIKKASVRKLICCCVACNLCTEDGSHFSSESHKTKQILFCDIFFCETCYVIFYCDRDTYNNHTLSIYHIRQKRCYDNFTVKECVLSISNSFHDAVFLKSPVKLNSSIQGASSPSIAIYFCKPCNKAEYTQLDWNLHLEKTFSHYLNISNSTLKFAEHVCLSCSAVIFGTVYNYIGHCHSEYHKKFTDFFSRNIDVFDSTIFNYLSKPSEKNAFDFLDSFNDSSSSSSENNSRFREKDNNVSRSSSTNDAMVVDRKEDSLEVASTDRNVTSSAADNRTKFLKNIDCYYNNGTNNNGIRNRNEQIVEKHLIIRGMPVKMLRKRRQVVQILSTFGIIKRTYIKKGSLTALYVVAGERTYQKLQENVQTLRNDFNAPDLKLTFTERTAFVNFPIINSNLSPEVVSLFSDLKQLGSIITSQILHAEEESKSIVLLTKIRDLQKSLIKYAENIFHEEYIRSFVFGSHVTNLASLQSDVDIFLDIGGSFRGIMGRSNIYQAELVRTFAFLMRKNSKEFAKIVPIPSARVPIVKFYHIPTKLHCDLSFKSGMSTLNSMLVRFYLNLDIRVKYIINAVKLWAYHNELSDRFLFTTYGLIWMVLFFLMNLELPVLPSVAELREFLSDGVKSCKIENWTCSFPNPCSIKWKSKNKLTVEQLLQLFFIYYSDSQLTDYVLCTLTGSKIEKSYFFHNYDQLPSVFDDYRCKLKENANFLCQIKASFDNLYLQDPFDLSHNLVKNIGHKKFQIFNGLCKKTADIMKYNVY